MKINFLLLTILTGAISSCSTSYKTGQTPDDVYYSPARLQTDNVRRDREENNTVDNTVYTNSEDREIRRRVRNRRYRRYDDRYDNPYGYNNGYYNNYPPVYGNPKTGTTQNNPQPRKTNLGAYSPNASPDSSNSTNPKLGNSNNKGTTNPVRTFGTGTTTNKESGVGNLIRRVFSGNNSSNTNYNSGNSNNSSSSRTFDNNSRSSNNNSNNNNSNSSNSNTKSSSTDTKSSGTSAPVRTFGKQN